MRSRSGGRMRGRSAGPAGGHRAVAALAMMIAWGVTGGCGEAVPPPLMVADASATRPTLALAPDGGGAWVAWVSDGASSDVWVRHVAADGTADPAPVRVNDVPGDAAPHGQAPARVAAGPEGHVYVTWQNNQIVEGRAFPASDLRFARSTDGGRTFEPAIFVNDDAGGPAASHTFHDMVVGPDGTVIVSWIDGRRGLSDPDIRLAASRDGGASFGSSVVVDAGACPCCRTALAVGPEGTIYVAWRKHFPGDVRDVVVARSTDGGRSFDEPVRVAADGWVFPGCPHAGPALTVAPDGTLHVGWYTGKEGGAGLFRATSVDGGLTFGAPDPLLEGDWVPPSQLSLAADAHGEVWVAWEDRRLEDPAFHLAPSSRSTEKTIPTAGVYPSVATAGARVGVAWLEAGAVRLRMHESSP